ncbi:PREDICTED: replication protein A 70 kDa DNA-binding subunit-like [Trachymyrmex cornetzi]|uniref:Replication protein A 70 kDa DNA-binding subunit n=1 Tax=Trachymyrmex cornetzi TaxID=471704 RepID=A0A195EGH4_9HYME|nr:PREDICTED: replication protein A 70 kDa DNA-binding subunit-like [Trachymyrmex cornetzi]KYN27251.1 Replication protein A 70 kDa DNA-binding subunit [Trachymyrmex cornetzi]
MYNLTEGALEKIMRDIDVPNPVLQVLSYKKLPRNANKDGSGNDRFRLLISDGQKLNSFTMLSAQLNDLITKNILNDYAICEITKYFMSSVYNNGEYKRVMLILDMEVLVSGDQVGNKIGNPTNIEMKP